MTMFIAFLTACDPYNDSDLCSNPIEVTGAPATGYIVIPKGGIDPSLIASEYAEKYGSQIKIYIVSSSFFAAEMGTDVLSHLQCDSRIAAIEYDSVVTIN